MISDDISLVQYLSKTFTCSPNGTLPNKGKALVKVNFLSHLQYLSGSLSKPLSLLKVYFRAVLKPGYVKISLINLFLFWRCFHTSKWKRGCHLLCIACRGTWPFEAVFESVPAIRAGYGDTSLNTALFLYRWLLILYSDVDRSTLAAHLQLQIQDLVEGRKGVLRKFR